MIDRLSSIFFIFLFIALPLAFISTHTPYYPYVHSVALFTPVKETVARLITLLLLALLGYQWLFLKKPVVKTTIYLPLLLLILYQALSLTWAHNPYQGFEHWLHWLTLSAFFFVCLNLSDGELRIQKIMRLSLFPAIIICVTSLICCLFQVDLPFFSKRDFWWATTFGNYKFAGEYIAPLIFWALALFSIESQNKKRIFYLCIAAGLFLSLIFLFKSRASLVAVLTLSTAASFFSPFFRNLFSSKKKRNVFLSFICSGILVLLFLRILSPTIFERGHTTNLQRGIIWKNTIRLIHDHPWLGVGIGNFNLTYPFYTLPKDRYLIPETSYWDDFARQTHNEYLQLFSELGFPGFLFCLVIFFIVFKNSYRYLRTPLDERAGSPQDRSLQGRRPQGFVFFLFLSFLCQAIIALFVFNFQNADTSFFFVATTAFLMKITLPPVASPFPKEMGAQYNYETNQPERLVRLPYLKRRIVTALITLPFFIFAATLLSKHALSVYFRQQGQSLHYVADFKAVSVFQRALKWSPNDWETHFMIGKGYGDHLFFPQAVSHLKKSLELNPSYVSTYYNLGIYLEKSKRWEEAADTFHELLKIAPDFRKANVRLGIIALEQNNVKEAKAYFQNALLPAAYQQSAMAEAYRVLALCHLREGNDSKISKEFLESFLISPSMDDSTLQFWMKKLE